jgi:hypothetical protein
MGESVGYTMGGGRRNDRLLCWPLACAGVTLYLLYTAHQIDVWDSRLDACLAGL